MKKTYKLENLECANCAAKMADGIRTLDGVLSADVNFITQKLTIEVESEDALDGIIKAAKKICRKIEPDCEIIA